MNNIYYICGNIIINTHIYMKKSFTHSIILGLILGFITAIILSFANVESFSMLWWVLDISLIAFFIFLYNIILGVIRKIKSSTRSRRYRRWNERSHPDFYVTTDDKSTSSSTEDKFNI